MKQVSLLFSGIVCTLLVVLDASTGCSEPLLTTTFRGEAEELTVAGNPAYAILEEGNFRGATEFPANQENVATIMGALAANGNSGALTQTYSNPKILSQGLLQTETLLRANGVNTYWVAHLYFGYAPGPPPTITLTKALFSFRPPNLPPPAPQPREFGPDLVNELVQLGQGNQRVLNIADGDFRGRVLLKTFNGNNDFQIVANFALPEPTSTTFLGGAAAAFLLMGARRRYCRLSTAARHRV